MAATKELNIHNIDANKPIVFSGEALLNLIQAQDVEGCLGVIAAEDASHFIEAISKIEQFPFLEKKMNGHYMYEDGSPLILITLKVDSWLVVCDSLREEAYELSVELSDTFNKWLSRGVEQVTARFEQINNPDK